MNECFFPYWPLGPCGRPQGGKGKIFGDLAWCNRGARDTQIFVFMPFLNLHVPYFVKYIFFYKVLGNTGTVRFYGRCTGWGIAKPESRAHVDRCPCGKALGKVPCGCIIFACAIVKDQDESPCKLLGSCAKNSFSEGSHGMGYTCTWSLAFVFQRFEHLAIYWEWF